jgi:hypothetical protein
LQGIPNRREVTVALIIGLALIESLVIYTLVIALYAAGESAERGYADEAAGSIERIHFMPENGAVLKTQPRFC